MTVSALNFKPYAHGAIKGFFDLRYYGLTIKGCRLMAGKNGGSWIALPQQRGEENGESKYYELMFLSPPEMDHVRKLVVAELRSQGHVEVSSSKGSGSKQSNGKRTHITPEGEDLSEYYSDPNDNDDIPF